MLRRNIGTCMKQFSAYVPVTSSVAEQQVALKTLESLFKKTTTCLVSGGNKDYILNCAAVARLVIFRNKRRFRLLTNGINTHIITFNVRILLRRRKTVATRTEEQITAIPVNLCTFTARVSLWQ